MRAASVGFDWTRPGDVVDKIEEEVDELREVVGTGDAVDQARAEEEMGDLLFAIANLSRKLGIEPETALRKANEKFTSRFEAMERHIADSSRTMPACHSRSWSESGSASKRLTGSNQRWPRRHARLK